MKKFNDYEGIKDAYDSGKYVIIYEDPSKDVKYVVSHIGSTIYCRNEEKGMGMGAINNFPIENFYAVDKPIVVVEEDKDECQE